MRLKTSVMLLVILSLTDCSASFSQTALTDGWPDRCLGLREKLAGTPGIDVVFSERPASSLSNIPLWRLDWQGTPLPVVPASYHRIMVIPHSSPVPHSSRNQFLLTSPAGHSLFLGYLDGVAPMEDVFAKSDGIGAKSRKNKDNIQLTRELWGGPVGVMEVLSGGFEATPKHLTCAPENWRQEMKWATGLILKNIEADTLERAYRLPRAGAFALVTRHKKGTGAIIWRALLPGADGSEWATQIDLTVPCNHPAADVGIGIGFPDSFQPVKPPKWFTHLQSVLENESPENWQTLLESLEEAGFRQTDIDRLRRDILPR